MKFYIQRASELIHPQFEKPCEKSTDESILLEDLTRVHEIEINTLEELLELQQEVGVSLVVGDAEYGEKGRKIITIYDDCIE